MIKQERQSSKIRNYKTGWHIKKNLRNVSRTRLTKLKSRRHKTS